LVNLILTSKLLLVITKIFLTITQLDMTTIYGEDRLNNVIGFETDKKLLAGLAFNIMFQQGENTSDSKEGATGYDDKRDGFGDGVSASLNYENKDIGLAAAVAGNRAFKVNTMLIA
jgi:predicted porin